MVQGLTSATSASVVAKDSIKNDLYVRFLTAEILESEKKKKATMEKVDNIEVRDLLQNIESNFICGLYKALMIYLDVRLDLDYIPEDDLLNDKTAA